MFRLLSGVIAAWGLMAYALADDHIVFPSDPSVLNLKRDFGAVGDGIANDTAALQKAFDASGGMGGPSKILWIPNGTYLVTNTLVVHTLGPWVYGETRDGVVIRLADRARQSVTNCTSVIRTHPSDSQATSSDFFMRNFHNFTVDVGNNPRVDGIRWYGNNTSLLKDIRVLGRGVGGIGINAGFIGLNGPNLIQDTVVEGFDTGISAPFVWGETISRVTIRDCRVQGIYVLANSVGIEDLLVENTPVGLNVDNYPPFSGWNGVVALVGATFRGGNPSGPAITNTGTLYARNVMSSGFKQALIGRGAKGSVTSPNIVEFFSEDPVRLFANSTRTSLQLPIKPEPDLPWENRLGNWVCANNYGAVYGSGADNTAAFQRAIDAATARGATTVYLRGSDGGTYQMNGEVKVRGSVQRFMALGWGRIVAGSTNAKFIVDDTSAPIVKFHNLQAFGGRPVTVENRSSTNAMVVESSDVTPLGTGRGDIFVTDCSCRVKLLSPGQNLWARQLNPEGDDNVGLVQNYGANLWVLGVKHEGGGIRFRTSDGGKTEVLGLFNYSTGVQDNDSRPMFDVDNSAFTAAGVREITFGNAYEVKLREVRQGSIQQNRQGGWTGWALYSGWNPGLTNGPTAAALPVVEPADSQFNANAGVFVNTGRHTWLWPGGGSFVDSLDLTATTSTPNAQLRYTADGTEPSLASTPWPQVLTISNSVTIKVKAFAPPLAPSATAVIPLTALAPRPPNPSWGPANGLNYAYYEIPVGSTRLPAFANLTAKTNGVAPIPDATPRLREKGFALRFTGALTIPTRGIYGFFLSSSDGSRLFLGNDLLIDNNGAHGNQEKSRYLAMEAGQYPISVEFFNGGGTHDLTLSYEGPNLPKQPIPASAFVVRNSIPIPPPTTPGLEYQYFQGSWSALPNFDSLQPVKVGITGAVSIAPRLRNNDYGLRLFGWIYLPKDGVWRFSTTSDDGSALFLGSTQIVKNDGTHGMVEQSGTVAAVAGLHPFIVTFFQGNGGQGLIASYEGPDTPKRVIPTTAYFRSQPGIVQTGLSRDQFWLDYLRPVYGPASAYQYLVDASEDLPNWSGGLPQINQSNVLSDPPYRLVRAYHPESTTLFTHGFLRLTVKSP